MKKILFIIISFIVVVLSMMFIFCKKVEFSENENRYLEKMPAFKIETLVNGKYINELQSFITDHFPFRNFFVGLKTRVDILIGKKNIDDIYLGKDNYMLTRYNAIDDNKVIEILNKFKNNKDDKNISLILIPSSISIYSEKLPKYAITDSEIDVINNIYENVNMNNIKLYDSFMNLKKSNDVFYKTDHHYTTYGAYSVYLEYCYNNNIVPLDISYFNITEFSDKFYGTLYSKTNYYDALPDSIYLFKTNTDYDVEYMDSHVVTKSLYDYDYINKKDKYSVFLSNNHSLINIVNNDIDSNKELLVIKDSYGNSFVPFISENYKKVHVVDLRYNLNSMTKYLKNNSNINDVVIIYNINTINNESGIYNLR